MSLDPSYWDGYPVSATRALATINKFNLKPMRPLILALALKFKPTAFKTAIKMLVSLSVRLVITGSTRSGVIEQAFAGAALGVSEESVTTQSQLKTTLKNVMVSDADFEEGFTTARVTKSDLARYYLHSLEAANADEAEPWYVSNDDPSSITLEHVLPTNAVPSDWSDFDDEARRRSVKRIGNLCLLTKTGNENAGNFAFSTKQPTYQNAPYALTSEIGAYGQWTATEIEARQKSLAKLAVKAWPI